jgi:hypothetical protein
LSKSYKNRSHAVGWNSEWWADKTNPLDPTDLNCTIPKKISEAQKPRLILIEKNQFWLSRNRHDLGGLLIEKIPKALNSYLLFLGIRHLQYRPRQSRCFWSQNFSIFPAQLAAGHLYALEPLEEGRVQ